jgi:hypothetical protein
MEEAQPEEQLLELSWPLAAAEEGCVTDWVCQVAAKEVLQ